MKTGVKVMDAMTREPVTISPSATISDAAKKMIENGVGGILVLENQEPKGILTEKDIVKNIVAPRLDPGEIKVRDVMAKILVTISPDKDIYDALLLMGEKDLRRLPVVHENKVVGLLTFKDVIRIQPQLFDVIAEKFRIKEEPTKPLNNSRKSLEGYCEKCNSYESLYNRAGSYLCEDCIASM